MRLSLGLLLAMVTAAQAATPDPARDLAGLRWRSIGPFRAGRTVAASGIPSLPNVFYVAANNGGVWKSTDYGLVWRPIFDNQPTGSIGTLAIAPSNPDIIYVGSGEGLQRPDLSVGDGIYKSQDGGKTWEHLGLRDGLQIASILIHPNDPDRLWVAVLGHPYGPNEERGVYRSTDGGRSFQKVLYKDENTGAVDLAFDPRNPDIIYTVLWAGRQGPWENGAWDGPESGLYRSTDSGATWRKLTRGLPTYEQGLGRIGIGVAPSDPNRLYALVEARNGGLFRSDDAGESWAQVNNEPRIWGRGNDFAWVRVDPRSPDTVLVANTSTYRSTDGGHTFRCIKGAPGGDDYHSIWINPLQPDIILQAADQGATISVNNGETWSSWYNQPTAQFYHVSTDNRFPYWVYGGQQESGSAAVASRGDNGQITFRDWHPVGVEEYGYVAPDPLKPDIVYGGKVSRYSHRTGQVQQVGPIAARASAGKYRFLRTAPVLFSPVNPRILYFAGNVLFKTLNGGRNWTVISPDLSRESYEIPPSVGIYTAQAKSQATRRGVIYTVAPSYRDVNLIWAGTDDGLIHVTRDGGRTWKNVTPPGLTPWSKVSIMDASHFDRSTAYAAVNRIRCDDLRPHIYRTRDGGKTWTEIVSGLPANEPVNTVKEDPVRRGLLFAGTERAVYVSFNDGDAWVPLRRNMPATSIRDLVIHESDLVVGTHGRGFWILDDISPLRQMDGESSQLAAQLYQPRTAYRVRRNLNTDTPLPPEEPAGENPPDGATIYYRLGATPSAPVTLEILDRAGKLVRRYSSADKPEVTEEQLARELNVMTEWVRMPRILEATPGMHRWVWDFRYAPPDSLGHGYPLSAIWHDTPRYPLGPLALPGQYTARLTVDGRTYTQTFTLKMDPRVSITPAALAQQFNLSQQLSTIMRRTRAAIEEIRDTRARLPKDDAGAKLDGELAELSGGGGRRRGGGGGGARGGAVESLPALNGAASGLFEVIEGADASPTPQAAAAVRELSETAARQLARWEQLRPK
jgi:photosystem II stability/assembly factor-like uncharacterized protein